MIEAPRILRGNTRETRFGWKRIARRAWHDPESAFGELSVTPLQDDNLPIILHETTRGWRTRNSVWHFNWINSCWEFPKDSNYGWNCWRQQLRTTLAGLKYPWYSMGMYAEGLNEFFFTRSDYVIESSRGELSNLEDYAEQILMPWLDGMLRWIEMLDEYATRFRYARAGCELVEFDGVAWLRPFLIVIRECGIDVMPVLAALGSMQLSEVIEYLLETGTVVRSPDGQLHMRRNSELGDIANDSEGMQAGLYPGGNILGHSITGRANLDDSSSRYVIDGKQSGSAGNINARVGDLTANLHHPDWNVAAAAAGELARIGEEAIGAIPIMAELLNSENPDIRGHMARALGEFGPAAMIALDDLMPLLGDTSNCWNEDAPSSFPVRFRAAFAIGNIVPTNESVLPIICEGLTNENRHVRHEAHGFVRRNLELSEWFTPVLLRELEHRNPLRQLFARITVSVIDPEHDEQDEMVLRLAKLWRKEHKS